MQKLSRAVNPPCKMTTVKALQSGKRVEQGAPEKKEPYKGLDAYTKVMPSWDKVECVLNDLAHAYSNLVKNILSLMANTNNMAFTPARRDWEHSIGRFTSYTVARLPWRTSRERGTVMQSFWVDFKVPSNTTQQTAVFTEPKQMKIAEALDFLGDRGKFWIYKSDLDDAYKAAFIALIEATQNFLAKIPDRTKIEAYQMQLVESLATLECMLPMYWNTITLHLQLCKAADQVLKWGAFWAQNMLHVERLHVLLKNLCRGVI